MCLYPRLILNPKYKPNKKNNYNPPKPKDKRIMLVPIKCNKCQECRNQIANVWKTRLSAELEQNNEKAYMVTLTFNEKSMQELTYYHAEKNEGIIGDDNDIATTAIRLFLERWRKIHKKSVKHWLITEKGHQGTERIHLHGIIWTNEDPDKITEIWKYGYTFIGSYVNLQTINYIIKYVTKVDNDHKDFTGKILTSKGIGAKKLNQMRNFNFYNNEKTKEYTVLPNGTKINLPIYYRNHLYNEEQREKLWINKIDKQTRYITGTKYYTRNSEEIKSFMQALKEAQKTSKRNGYGEPEWNKKDYMNTLKNLNKS